VATALIGVLFFFIIVGVFGLPLAIAGLAADSMCQPCVCSYTYGRPMSGGLASDGLLTTAAKVQPARLLPRKALTPTTK
jgi:hypothetical protein